MFKSELSRIFLLSLFLVLGLMALSFLLFSSGFNPAYVDEAPLPKNAEFAMRPGDGLAYGTDYMNRTDTVAFVFGRKPVGGNATRIIFANCTLAVIQGSNESVCIAPDGRDGGDNRSLSSPDFFFFSPWMLALSPGFSWHAELQNSITREPISEFSVSYAGTGTIYGRAAYIVDVNETGFLGNSSRKIWVDQRERIMLKEEGNNYTIRLVQAPFALAQENKSEN